MAIRMALRLEKAWHQKPWINNDGRVYKTDLLYDLRKERDRAVDSYLKIREANARIAHQEGIAARSAGTALRKPRRPPARRKKIKTA